MMDSYRSVFVVGGTGLVGSHAVAALLRAGCRVTMLARRVPKEAVAPGVRVVLGDLERPADLASHLRGHEVVLNAAGAVDAPPDSLRAVLVDATHDLIAAAEGHGVQRFVHVSSLSVLEPAGNGRWGTNARVQRVTAALPDYVRAKIDAESELEAARIRGAIEVVVVRPGVVLGPGDRATTPLVLRLLAHPFAIRVGTGENEIPCVAAEELGDALARAATQPGLAGMSANLAARERVTQRLLLEWHAGAAGLSMPRVRLTARVAERIADGFEIARRLTGLTPPITRLAVAIATADVGVDPGEPEARLGWRGAASCREAVRRAVDFTMARGSERGRPASHALLKAVDRAGRS
jgi:nucleoside-diphosphate-sugar epimerase